MAGCLHYKDRLLNDGEVPSFDARGGVYRDCTGYGLFPTEKNLKYVRCGVAPLAEILR